MIMAKLWVLILLLYLIKCFSESINVPGKEFQESFPAECIDPSSMITNSTMLQQLTFIPPSDVTYVANALRRVEQYRTSNKKISFLFSGSSITEMGYYHGFIEYLTNNGYNITSINKGHGAVDIVYQLYCVDFRDLSPLVIFVDIRHSDWNPDTPQFAEALIRKFFRLKPREGKALPLVVVVNFSHLNDDCILPIKFSQLFLYYGLPIIDFCQIVRFCFGANDYKYWSNYSSDSIHPTTTIAKKLITDALVFWWKDIQKYVSQHISLRNDSIKSLRSMKRGHLYSVSPVGDKTSCDTANQDAISVLMPISAPSGFQMITRIKTGAQGFQNIKKCWEGSKPGDNITFSFYGDRLHVAIYQKSEGMGVADVYLDDETNPRTKLNGFFEGYDWNPDIKKNGRQMILKVFTDLPFKSHNITFVISAVPSSAVNPGYSFQIIALLYSRY